MASWAQLVLQVQTDLQDALGVFHTDARVRDYLEDAELLLSMRRSLYEKTLILPLTSATPLYLIHSITGFADFIRPLRVTVNGVALRWTSLAAVGRLNRRWHRTPGPAESVFMIGSTILAFAPLPSEKSAQLTYLARAPVGNQNPVIDSQYHPTLKKYGEAICLAKEGSYDRAATALKEFLALASIERDARFLEGFAQRTANVTRTTERRAQD